MLTLQLLSLVRSQFLYSAEAMLQELENIALLSSFSEQFEDELQSIKQTIRQHCFQVMFLKFTNFCLFRPIANMHNVGGKGGPDFCCWMES